jgi:hypothetical protein
MNAPVCSSAQPSAGRAEVLHAMRFECGGVECNAQATLRIENLQKIRRRRIRW